MVFRFFQKMNFRIFAGVLFGCGLSGGVASATERSYFLAADELAWNYAPAGDVTSPEGKGSVDSDVWLKRGLNADAPIFRKVVYHEYTDASFKTPKRRAPEAEYLGLLGPIIRAE